jgi:hypothetical protein
MGYSKLYYTLLNMKKVVIFDKFAFFFACLQ